jgi:hypothetical protein
MKLRCEYLQSKLDSVSTDVDAEEPRHIPRKYMDLYENHYRELESDRHLDRVIKSLSQDQRRCVEGDISMDFLSLILFCRQYNQTADYGPADTYLFSGKYTQAKNTFWHANSTNVDSKVNAFLDTNHQQTLSLNSPQKFAASQSFGGRRREPPPPPQRDVNR